MLASSALTEYINLYLVYAMLLDRISGLKSSLLEEFEGACILGQLLGIFLINLQTNFDGDALNFEANGVMLILSWKTSVIALRMKARRLLQNNNIFDPIPIELGTIPLLQTLDLLNNRFSGPIPTSFAQLNSLYYLLNNNSLFEPFLLSLAKIPQFALIHYTLCYFFAVDWFMWSIFEGPLFKLITVDWFKVDKSFDDIALHPRNLVQSVQESTTTFEELARVQNHPLGKSAIELVISITKTQTKVELILESTKTIGCERFQFKMGDPLICMGESGLCSRLNMPTILGIPLIGELGTHLHKKEFTPSL
uniref:Uncharacterized protein n=1 Tax=Cucumis melo TaxID=3656 RepID=A0A9I9E7K9_CUCME